MATRSSRAGAYRSGILLGTFAAAMLVFCWLQLARSNMRYALLTQNYTLWRHTPVYLQVVTGHSLAFAHLHSQFMIVLATLVSGVAFGAICITLAAIDMGLAPKIVRNSFLAACGSTILAGYMVFRLSVTPVPLEINLDGASIIGLHGVADSAMALGAVSKFEAYIPGLGIIGPWDVGMQTVDGKRVKLLHVPGRKAARDLAAAIQGFCDSHGAVFPAGPAG